MIPFVPTRIYIDTAVAGMAVTKRVLDKFPDVVTEYIDSPDILKKPIPMTEAKKMLLVTKSRGDGIKSCQGGGGDYVCCDYFTLSLVSNCHFECTYCILQDYLQNNPVISIFANIDEILGAVSKSIQAKPDRIFRIGTGELADSLGLDPITEFSKDLVAFTSKHPNMILELKTKSTFIENLENLDHQGRVVISWSVNPQDYIDQEE
ncbi:MAG: DNA repair photolyase-like protein, partial [uncultured bacterium]